MGTGGAGSGTGGAGGTSRDAGAAGSGTSPDAATAANCTVTFPTPASTTKVPSTIKVSGTYDGMMKGFVSNGLGSGDQSEGQSPLFELADGSVLKNVIIGNPAADGVHCTGSCTLQNVWWQDVGEDAATLKGKSASQTMTIEGGGAMHAADKVFQHDGPGTIIVRNFFVSDFGKLYRSCGNCGTQYERHLVVENLTAVNLGGAVAGVNTNYNDSATFKNLVLCDRTRKMAVCDRYTGNDTGAEPPLTGSGPDSKYCIYANTDLQWVFF